MDKLEKIRKVATIAFCIRNEKYFLSPTIKSVYVNSDEDLYNLLSIKNINFGILSYRENKPGLILPVYIRYNPSAIGPFEAIVLEFLKPLCIVSTIYPMIEDKSKWSKFRCKLLGFIIKLKEMKKYISKNTYFMTDIIGGKEY